MMTTTGASFGRRRFAWISPALVFALWLMAFPAPGFAHTAGLHASARDSLHDPNVRSQAEGVDTELEGTLEILHEDREDGSGVYHHFLSTHDGKRVPLEGVQHPDLLTGDFVRVRGIRSGQKLQLKTTTAAALEVLQFAPLPNTFGPQKTAVFLVNFADSSSYQPFTTSAMKSFLDDNYSQFFSAASYGQTSLVVDVLGWYTMPFINSGCPSGAIQYYAEQAAVASGINLSEYTRRVYFFPHTSCMWGGLGTIGGNPSHAWLNGSLGNFIHELGHNLGLYHSHLMSCAPEILGPNCTTSEYGDITDAMGSGGHFNPFQKQRLGWLNYGVSPPITKVQQSGTYTIDAYDLPETTPKALKIQRGATAQAFFVALHRLVSFEYVAGVFVHLTTDGAVDSSYLLDMTPETPDRQRDGYLDVGKSFTDPVSGITITTVSVSSTSATIMVDMGGVPPSLPPTPTTLAGGPQLTWKPGTPTTQTGFVVERAAGATAAFASIATTTAPNYLDTSGVAGQCYRVRATNAGGTSGPSNVACAPAPPSPPPTPTSLAGGPQLTWMPGVPATQAGFVVERATGPTTPFVSIATTTASNYLDASGIVGNCYRVRATNAAGTSGPSNVSCASATSGITLTITSNSPIGREMTFGGTLTGSVTLSASTDGIAIASKYVVVDKVRKTWTVKATGLLPGPHTFTVTSGTATASKSFTVLK